MDLLRFVRHGATIAGNPAQRMAAERETRQQARHQAIRLDMIRKARDLWRNALLVDETRGWFGTLEQNPEVLSGLFAILSTVAVAQVADTSEDDPKVRVIRGALRAIEQSSKGGSVISHELLASVASAANHAKDIVDTCTDSAIEHAAHYMHAMARLKGLS